MTASNGTSQTYTYNQALELAGTGQEVSYTYNGDGLRMSKTAGATTAPFTWDVAKELPLVLEDGTNTYVYGPGARPVEQMTGNNAAPGYLIGTVGGFLGGFIFGFAHNAEYAPPWH